MEIEYVFSAWANFLFINNKDEEILKWSLNNYKNNLDYILSKLSNSIKFSSLYNAFYEPELWERIHKIDNKAGHKSIYADSGGLQMMKQGLEVTDEIKEKIYLHQAKFSDFAFSFDEIPSIMEEGRRVFIEDKVIPSGIKAGLNLKNQINLFQREKSKAKVIPITQGYGVEQINDYTKNMLSQLSNEEMDSIESIALGNAHGNGYGVLESYSAFLQMGYLKPNLKNHVHLLGTTGFDRIIPLLQLIKNGLSNTNKISFDSSYHSKTYAFGNLQKSVDWCINGMQPDKIGLKRNDFTEKVFKEIEEFWKDCETFNLDTFDDFFEYSTLNETGLRTPTQRLSNNDFEGYKKNVNIIQMYVLTNVFKYLQVIDYFLQDKLSMEQILHNKKYQQFYLPLKNIRTEGELEDYLNSLKKSYKVSDTISIKTLNNLKQNSSEMLF